MKTCFMFGHSDTPDVFLKLAWALEYCYNELGIRRFVAGSRGNFDTSEVFAGLIYLKSCHKDIETQRLIAYHPALRRKELRVDEKFYDSTYYPGGLEKTPYVYAIRKANEIMVTKADFVICYVTHPGNARNLLEYVIKHKVPYINLAEQEEQLEI